MAIFSYRSVRVLTVAAALILPTLALAQQYPFTECGDSSPTYKLLLDEFGYAEPTLANDPQFASLLHLLEWKLSNSAKILELETQSVAYQAIPCQGRSPRDGSIFSAAVTDALNARNVILEIWGVLDETQAGGHVSSRIARVGYTVVPVRFYENSGPLHLSGIYLVEYSTNPQQHGQQIVDLLGESRELSAYWKVAVGVKAMKAGDYDRARGYLCQAAVELKAISKQDQGLSDYVKLSAQKVVTMARSDAAYKGSLKLTGADQSCS